MKENQEFAVFEDHDDGSPMFCGRFDSKHEAEHEAKTWQEAEPDSHVKYFVAPLPAYGVA